MTDYGPLKAIQILALRSVLDGDEEYELRKIFRWYSKTFATPLHVVSELPIIDVALAYYEATFEEKGPEELADIAFQLTEKEEDRIARELEAERVAVEDYEYLKSVSEGVKKEQKEKSKQKESLNTIVEATKKLNQAFGKLDETVKKLEEAKLPGSDEDLPPPDINVSFVDSLEEEINNHDLSLFDKPKKG